MFLCLLNEKKEHETGILQKTKKGEQGERAYQYSQVFSTLLIRINLFLYER